MNNKYPTGLVLLNTLLILMASGAILSEQYGNTKLFAVLKPLTTLLVILIAMSYGFKTHRRYYSSSLIALTFCLIGDVFLLWPDQFIWGLLAFLVGHLLFIYSFSSFGIKGIWVILWMLLAYGIGIYAYLFPGLEDLAIPVGVYVLVIIMMGWRGISLYFSDRKTGFLIIGLGVLLFMLSDSILAINKFKIAFEGAGIFILATYWAAVGLLANAGWFLRRGEGWTV